MVTPTVSASDWKGTGRIPAWVGFAAFITYGRF